jgi:putative transposase
MGISIGYLFIQEHVWQYPLHRLCKVMNVHPSGYYAWLAKPHSDRAIEDRRLIGHIKQSWIESGSVYGYRKVTDDLHDLGEICGKHRVYRLMRSEKLRSQTGCHRRPGKRGGSVANFAPNHLQQQFDVEAPNQVPPYGIISFKTNMTYYLISQQ